jgi:hypothetical protein
MKTLINKITLLALAVVLTLCTPIDHDTEVLDGLQQARKNLTQSEAYFLGDANEVGTEVYSLRLMSKDVSVNYKIASQAITENAYAGNGYVVYFELSDSIVSDFPEGEFTFDKSEEPEAGTFSNAYLIVLHDGAIAADAEKVGMSNGTVKVSKTGENYKVEMDLVLNNGSKLELNYTGAIEAADPAFLREPLKEETIDWEMTDFSFESENIDEDYDGGMDFSFGTLTLSGKNGTIVIDEIYDDNLYPIGDEPERLAAGTYTIVDEDFSPGEIYKDKLYGSYAINGAAAAFGKIWYFDDGEVVVTETASEYKIVVTATSVNGTTISATYVEAIED